MAEEFKDPVEPDSGMPDTGKSFTWSQVWIQALTRPSVETYERLIRDPNASPNKAYLWIFASSFVGYIIYFLLSLAFPSPFAFGEFADISPSAYVGSAILQLVCCLPFAAVLGVIGVMISAAITQFVAKLLGGTGIYSDLVYIFAAISAPLSLISSVLAPIPFVNCLGALLGLYSVVLLVIAVNAVNNFGWGKAVFAYFAIPVLLLLLAICGIICSLTLLAPEIDSVFNDIINALETPVP